MHPEIHVLGITAPDLRAGDGARLRRSPGVAAGRYLEELGRPVDWAYEMVFAALIGGLVGARLWWVVENWSQAKGDCSARCSPAPGSSSTAARSAARSRVLAWARWRGVLDLRTLDVARRAARASATRIGRVGCQLAGDGDYGKAWDGPWAMAYPHGTVPTTTPVHPTPVYETLAMGLVAVCAVALRAPRGGRATLFAATSCWPGVERFLVEFLRRNPVGARPDAAAAAVGGDDRRRRGLARTRCAAHGARGGRPRGRACLMR